MALNKFSSLINTEKKELITHAEIQKNSTIKKGGRPKKADHEKKSFIVSLNVSPYEKEILESEAKGMGLNVVSLARMSLANALKDDFAPVSLLASTTPTNKSNVAKQYAIPLTEATKKALEEKADFFMISISDLLKMALKKSGFYNT